MSSNPPKTKLTGDDIYLTPDYGVEPIVKYIPDYVKTIWCPCDLPNSEYVKVLTKYGYKVISSHIDNGEDFLKYKPSEEYDMIITNPPYSLKTKMIRRCYELGKPWALLLPLTALETMERGKMYKDNGVGLVVLNKRIAFIGASATNKGAWFNTSYFIHTPDLDGKIIFEEI